MGCESKQKGVELIVSCRTCGRVLTIGAGISNRWTSSMSGRCRPLSHLEVSEIGGDVGTRLLLLTDDHNGDDDDKI